MLSNAQRTKYSPFDSNNNNQCQCCGKKLTIEECTNLSAWNFIITCKKHRKYANIKPWNIFRLPRKLKKRLRKIYRDTQYERGLIQKFCVFKSTTRKIYVYAKEQSIRNTGRYNKIIEHLLKN